MPIQKKKIENIMTQKIDAIPDLKRPRVLVLHARLSGYFMACLNSLAATTSGQIHVIAKAAGNQSPFESFALADGITVATWRDNPRDEIERLPKNVIPNVVLLSGWWNREYLAIARRYRRMGAPVVMGMDNPWVGGLRQQLKQHIVRRKIDGIVSHIWIPGMPQYPLAKKLGFRAGQILVGYYVCDTSVFIPPKKRVAPRGFIYVGRLSAEKNLSGLLKSYQAYAAQSINPWPLTVVGSGPLKHLVQENSNVEYISFVDPAKLLDLLQSAKAFVIASNFEPWGVVIQEAASCGLPLICSDKCGAATQYLIDWHNGLRFSPDESSQELSNCFEILSSLPAKTLGKWGQNSTQLAQTHTVQSWSNTLIDAVLS